MTEPVYPPPSEPFQVGRQALKALATVGEALIGLTSEEQARVLATSAILTGTGDRVTEILTGDA